MLLKLLFTIRLSCLPRAVAKTQRQVIPCDSPHVWNKDKNGCLKTPYTRICKCPPGAREMALMGDIILYGVHIPGEGSTA